MTIDDVPLMIADVFPCNKVFRIDFWRDQGLAFPVDVRYEDQVLCTQAFLVAAAFDVLTDVVYERNTRVDLSSATQARGRHQNLSDRMVTKQMTVDLVRGHGNPVLSDTLHREVLPIHMWEHFRAAAATTTVDLDRYWATLRAGQLEIWNDDTVPFQCTAVPAGQRLMGWLVAQDRRDDLARLVAQIDGPGVPVEEGRYLHPWVDEPGVPAVLSSARPPSARAQLGPRGPLRPHESRPRAHRRSGQLSHPFPGLLVEYVAQSRELHVVVAGSPGRAGRVSRGPAAASGASAAARPPCGPGPARAPRRATRPARPGSGGWPHRRPRPPVPRDRRAAPRGEPGDASRPGTGGSSPSCSAPRKRPTGARGRSRSTRPTGRCTPSRTTCGRAR